MTDLLTPYLKRTRSSEELIACLHLKANYPDDYQEALATLLGAQGLSANTV